MSNHSAKSTGKGKALFHMFEIMMAERVPVGASSPALIMTVWTLMDIVNVEIPLFKSIM